MNKLSHSISLFGLMKTNKSRIAKTKGKCLHSTGMSGVRVVKGVPVCVLEVSGQESLSECIPFRQE